MRRRKTNRAIVRAAWRRGRKSAGSRSRTTTRRRTCRPTRRKVDTKQKGGKRIQVKPEDVTTAGAAEAWMRAVQTSPADFLKLKFAIQATTAPHAAEPPR